MSQNAPRCAALVGPYTSGKTTLLESLLFVTGAIPRKGSIKERNTVGDSAPEARARQMSSEVNIASTSYLGDKWTFLDCPGSIEFFQETQNALLVADVAVIVAEAVIERAMALAPLFKFLDDHQIPHLVFINKMDTAARRVRDVLDALQAVSARPLVLRQVPIRDGGEAITGYVDLVSERTYKYKPGSASDLVPLPEDEKEREKQSRQTLLEALADFDDALLEQLLEDTVPDKTEIYKHLTRTVQEDKLVPVFLGAAEREHGVRRLLKTLRHEAPQPRATAARYGIAAAGEPCARVFKTFHMPHSGKLSLARIWRGEFSDGEHVHGERVSGLFTMLGHQTVKQAKAGAGEVVAFGRMEKLRTGELLTPSGKPVAGAEAWPKPITALFSVALQAENRQDEVKLTAALQKLAEEDPSLSFEQRADTHELLLWGQGEMHLNLAIDRLKDRNKLQVKARPPQIPYKETIRKPVTQHARHKKQSGGHGQFGDVKVEIKPLPRGSGFEFVDKIVGGSVPRQFIPSVEHGVRDFLPRGPLGFEVVDLSVTLFDGQFHAVDSSDMAFRTAARMAMSEGLPKCDPVLLEPILEVTVSAPNEYTSNVQRLITGRRGQILGFNAKEGWKGWDETTAHIPQSEIRDMIIELRSLSYGVGTFAWRFHHLQELIGREADHVIQQRQAPAQA
ncbi:MAG TPA: elongation factor G [Alphaproteobacteria bacterium]|nr:elongation factor G [Alphaproteobacteria bacterium]